MPSLPAWLSLSEARAYEKTRLQGPSQTKAQEKNRKKEHKTIWQKEKVIKGRKSITQR
jgi:hypothetical protein